MDHKTEEVSNLSSKSSEDSTPRTPKMLRTDKKVLAELAADSIQQSATVHLSPHFSSKSSKESTRWAPKKLQIDEKVFGELPVESLQQSVIPQSPAGFWVQARQAIISETPRISRVKSSTWRERLSKWKLAQEKFLCGSRNQSHDAKECGASSSFALGGREMDNELRRPLSRKVKIPSSNINPYRVMILLRLVILVFYLRDRLLTPVRTAYSLWLTSVICELWFCLSWVFEHLPRWSPVNRAVFPDRLCLRFNGLEGAEFPCIDIFVCTVDPVKESPLVMANTVLSILAVDYPADKVACYVSDDGASFLTLQLLLKTYEFARIWVPFCKKYEIEPRSPDWYLSRKVNSLKYNAFPLFAKERQEMKRQYEEFKVSISDLVNKSRSVPIDGWTMKDGTPWPGNDTEDHPAMIQILTGGGENSYGSKDLPQLIYVSREKRPGFQHNKKAGAMNALARVSAVLSNGTYILNLDWSHYINNSKALLETMCFMMEPGAEEKICYVQFPQRFDVFDDNGHYLSHKTIFYDVDLKCLDGVQGPIYVGTGCIFNRKALYGFSLSSHQIIERGYLSSRVPTEEQESLLGISALTTIERKFPSIFQSLEKVFGHSSFFLASTLVTDNQVYPSASNDEQLKQAIQVISCEYENNTAWGREIGWIYGSLNVDTVTGFKMHTRGWRSIYYAPLIPAFRGSAPISLSGHLRQVFYSALGSMEILLGRHCPIWYGYGGKLKPLQRMGYISNTIYPITSIPLFIYCTLPAVCLLTGKFMVPLVSAAASIWLPLFFLSTFVSRVLEMKWSGVGFQEWWRNHQFLVIAGVSSHLFAVLRGLLQVMTRRNTMTVRTEKFHPDNGHMPLNRLNWSLVLVLPSTLLLINLLAMVAGIAFALKNGSLSWNRLYSELFFACLVVVHLYPFCRGWFFNKPRTPTIIIVCSLILASLFSLLWLRANPFFTTYQGPTHTECGINC